MLFDVCWGQQRKQSPAGFFWGGGLAPLQLPAGPPLQMHDHERGGRPVSWWDLATLCDEGTWNNTLGLFGFSSPVTGPKSRSGQQVVLGELRTGQESQCGLGESA